MIKKRGISLIVLVITIIVIIILAGAVILSLANNNPISQATEATFKANLDSYNSQLSMYLSSNYATNSGYNPDMLNAKTWDGVSTTVGTIKEVISNITIEDAKKFEVQNGKLIYVGDSTVEQGYITSMGLQNKSIITVNTIATKNSTINGLIATYNNPIIPVGFKPINTTDASWSNITTDWNKGLVISDASGNQFVWVPVDGTNVTYSKWTTTGIAYNNSNISEGTLPTNFNEQTQISKYKGFYIARYESAFDYNGGSIRAASKISTNKTATDWSSTRNATYNGYLWNYVSQIDSKTYAENMDTSYGYDLSKVGTNLMTGTQWDTVLKWIQNSGKSVIDSKTWANHSDSIAPANITGFSSLQISGFSEQWKANNIYDLSGNIWEWTNENYSATRIHRGGGYSHSGVTHPAAYRGNGAGTAILNNLGFRVGLYIL